MEENKIMGNTPVAEAITSPAPEMPNVQGISGVVYAGFWKRLLAYFLDGVLLGVIFYILSLFSGNKNVNNGIMLAIEWMYFAFMESSAKQATLGKMILGIKVTDMNGERVSFGRASGRFFAKIISVIILCIGYIMIAFTKKKQGLHDIIAKTLVVKK